MNRVGHWFSPKLAVMAKPTVGDMVFRHQDCATDMHRARWQGVLLSGVALGFVLINL